MHTHGCSKRMEEVDHVVLSKIVMSSTYCLLPRLMSYLLEHKIKYSILSLYINDAKVSQFFVPVTFNEYHV